MREHERLLGLRDLGHGGLGEETAALQLPFLLLLQQLTAHQPCNGGVVGEDADHVGASLDLLVEAFPPPSGKMSPLLLTTAGASGDDLCGVTARPSRLM